MPAPSRDRLARPVDISALFRGAARRVDLVVDEPGLRWAGLTPNPNWNVFGSGSSGRRVLGLGHRRNIQRLTVGRRETRAMVTPARSVLPNWYPRTPLRDITGIVTAIERRRAELQVDQTGEHPQEENTDALSVSGAQPEHHEVGGITPVPTILMKPQPSPAIQAVKIMDGINLKENQAGLEFLTPEKKLLNSIEKVREVWLEEKRKLERTPAAKRAERERKVRVLKSMR